MKLIEKYFDVVVIGGGSAGVAAAVSAGRSGASTLLIEHYGFLGGQAVSANVGTICGLYPRSSRDDSLTSDFTKEFVSRLNAIVKYELGETKEGLIYLPYDPFAFETACSQMIVESGVTVFLHSTCFNVKTTQTSLDSVSVIVSNTPCEVFGKLFIDATGEGLVSKLAGDELLVDSSYQAPGFVFSVSGLTIPESLTERDLSMSILSILIEAEKSNLLSAGLGRVTVVPGSLRSGNCLLKFAYPICRTNQFNELTSLELVGRNSCLANFQYLKKNLSYFASSQLAFVSTQLGLRSGSRGKGMYVLSHNDVIQSTRFNDSIANGLWPIEMWGSERRAKIQYSTSGDYYQIPLRSLRSENRDNVLFAGRGISADSFAISSARVIGTAFDTGAAAGQYASRFIEEDILQIKASFNA